MSFMPKFLRFKRWKGVTLEFEQDFTVANPSNTQVEIEYMAYDIYLEKGGFSPLMQIRYDAKQASRPISIPGKVVSHTVTIPFEVNMLTAAYAAFRSFPSRVPSGSDEGKTDPTGIVERIKAIFKDGRYPKAIYTTGETWLKGLAVPIQVTDYEYQFSR